MIQARSYEPFGKQLSTAGNPLTKYGYTGEWTDPTSLVYLRARYYDPATGRFISKDPVRGFPNLPQTLNPYTYAINNPVRYTDPSGEFIDVALDIAFISYDIYTLVNHWNTGCGDITSDLLALGLDIGGALLPFATGLGMVARVGSKADDVTRFVSKIDDVVKIEKHHLLPREFRAFFERAGLNIEEYIMELPIKQHRLKPGGLHTGTENWNKAWKEFFSRFPNATRYEILSELSRLKMKYKLP